MAHLYKLADDEDEYGADAGLWLVVTDDGEHELSAPLTQAEATRVRDLINAISAGREA